MAADPQIVEASNTIVKTFGKYLIITVLIVTPIGIILAIIRRNSEEAINRFFWRRAKTEKKCPLDGGTLMKRRGKYGPFIGCSNYPTCTYTEGGKRD